jgi:hypothetical protein
MTAQPNDELQITPALPAKAGMINKGFLGAEF